MITLNLTIYTHTFVDNYSMMDDKFVEPLNNLIKAISDNPFNFQSALTELMGQLSSYYQQPEVHSNPVDFMTGKVGVRQFQDFLSMSTKLKTVVDDNTETTFLTCCPFTSLVVDLCDIVKNGNIGNHQNDVKNIKLQLQQMVNDITKVQPLLDMRELLNILLDTQVDLDAVNPNQKLSFQRAIESVQHGQGKNLAFALFGVLIVKCISTKELDIEPYKFLNWRMLRYIADRALVAQDTSTISTLIKNSSEDFHTIKTFIGELSWIEGTKYTAQPYNPDLRVVTLITLKDSAYTDKIYIELALEYLNSIDVMTEDNYNLSYRFAILRIITALGEISKNISGDLKAKYQQLFITLKDLRDSIVHENQAPSVSKSIESMLHDRTDTRLKQFKTNDLVQIKTFFIQIQQNNTPNAVNLSQEFVDSLTKDYKLTKEERDVLIRTLPDYDAREVADRRAKVERILGGDTSLCNNSSDIAELFNRLGLTDRKVKDMLVKFQHIKIAQNLILKDLKAPIVDDQAVKGKLKSLNSKNINIQSIISSKEALSKDLSQILVEYVRLSTEIIMNQIPTQIDISNDTKLLKAIIEQKNAQLPSSSELRKTLARCSIKGDVKEDWLKALEVIKGAKESSYVKNKPSYSTKPHMKVLNDINDMLSAINLLSDLMEPITKISSDRERFGLFLKNKPLIFACEYVYNLCTDNINRILGQINQHNLEFLQVELKKYKTQRNDIFHLNFLYMRPQENLEARYEYFYDSLMHRIEGSFYSKAIIVSTTVTTAPVKTVSLKQILTQAQSILQNNTLN